MDEKLKCPICGNEFEGGTFDVCECCGWSYLGYEDELEEDEIDSYNSKTSKGKLRKRVRHLGRSFD